MFVDKAEITVKGGDGGNGCVSFRREKFVPKGGPDGGNGGNGGDVVIEAAGGEQSLVDMVYNRHFAAENGLYGRGKKMHGPKGKSIVIKVPPGTVIKDMATDEIIADLNAPGSRFVVARGGKGGRGNTCFKTNRNKAPRQSEEGKTGEEKDILLELKTIADVGFVGYPNAGKSTLLGKISHAHPRIAPYPFTTLHPVVGVMEFEDFTRVKVADIPGLIDGAHDNVGLGHEFLKHIERTGMLVYILDAAGIDGRNPLDDFETLRRELEYYMKGLSERKHLVIANKTDLKDAGDNLKELKNKIPDIIPVSALNGDNLEALKLAVRNKLAEE